MLEGREGMGDKEIRDDWTTRNMTMSRDFREPTTQSGNQKRFWGWNSVPWHELNVTQRYSHTGTNMEDFHTRRSILRYWNTYSRNFHKADPAPWHKCHTKIQSWQEQTWKTHIRRIILRYWNTYSRNLLLLINGMFLKYNNPKMFVLYRFFST